MPDPGFDVLVVDDPLGGEDALATDTLYLLSPYGPASPTQFRRADSGQATLDAQLRAYFRDGGKSVFVQGYDALPAALPDLATAIGLLGIAPGQLVAPEVVTAPELIIVGEQGWAKNKVALLQGPTGATDAALTTLATSLISGGDLRGAALFADTGVQPALTGGGTENVPWSVTVAALIAASDRRTGNPNLAAAGKRGISLALGVTDLRNDTRRQALKDAQINTAKVVGGRVRNYGYRTLADLDTLPQWWDLSGSRTMMAFRARAAAVDEDFVFDPIDAHRVLLDRYESRLRAEAKDLYDVNALFGKTPDEAYKIDTSDTVNPIDELAVGEVASQVRLKTSPFAEHLTTTIVRRSLTAAL